MAEPSPHPAHGALDLVTIVAGPLDTNVYLATDRASRRSIVIDPGDDAPEILSTCTGLDVVAVVITHGHWDHVGAAETVATSLDVPLLIHPADAAASGLRGTGSLLEGWSPPGLPLTARHTPGHTPGSVCLVGPTMVFTGDTLFPGGPGRTEGAEQFDRIMHSLRTRIFDLDDATVVLPGHGASTTLGAERPFLDEWQERGW